MRGWFNGCVAARQQLTWEGVTGFARLEEVNLMSADHALEQRLAAVEAELEQLKRLVHARVPAPNWVEQLAGSMKDEPAFQEVIEYGRAFRQADRPPEDGAA